MGQDECTKVSRNQGKIKRPLFEKLIESKERHGSQKHESTSHNSIITEAALIELSSIISISGTYGSGLSV